VLHGHSIGRTASRAAGRSGGRVDKVAVALRHITERDWRLLRLLDEHGVLTTRQITTVCFGAYTTADARLRRLYRLGLLDRFRRHNQRAGTLTGWHWTIGVLGARLVALVDGRSPPSPEAVARRRDALAASPRLAHLLGVNQLFVQLIGHARTHPGTGLARWWSEQRTTEAFGQRIRPDGHGVWYADGRRVGFVVEHDTGSEPVQRLVAKLPAYARLTSAGGPAWPVLFWLPSPARAGHLAAALANAPALPFPVAIAARTPSHRVGLIDAGPDPAGAIWRLHDEAEPVALHQLPCPDRPTGPLNPGLD